MVETTKSQNQDGQGDSKVPTIAFIGKTGAGKSTLINALSVDQNGNWCETASVADQVEINSHTQTVTTYENMNWFDMDGTVHLVDVPGLDDTKGQDQQNCDSTVTELRKLETVSLVVIVMPCNEKFSHSMQTLVQTYINMIMSSKQQNIWDNVCVVLTKHAYHKGMHKSFERWTNVANEYKNNFMRCFQEACPGANPQFFVISYPDPEWETKETDGKSEQYHYTIDQMKQLKQKALFLFHSKNLDMSKIQFIMTKETYNQWVQSKNESLQEFGDNLNNILCYQGVHEMIKTSLNEVETQLKDQAIASEEHFKHQLQENLDKQFQSKLKSQIDPEISKTCQKLYEDFQKYIVAANFDEEQFKQQFFATGKDYVKDMSGNQKTLVGAGMVAGGVSGGAALASTATATAVMATTAAVATTSAGTATAASVTTAVAAPTLAATVANAQVTAGVVWLQTGSISAVGNFLSIEAAKYATAQAIASSATAASTAAASAATAAATTVEATAAAASTSAAAGIAGLSGGALLGVAAAGVVCAATGGYLIYKLVDSFNMSNDTELDREKARQEFTEQFTNKFVADHQTNMIQDTQKRIRQAVEKMEQEYNQYFNVQLQNLQQDSGVAQDGTHD